MKKNNMSEFLCAFVKAHHNNNVKYVLYKDEFINKLLTTQEYNDISNAITGEMKLCSGDLNLSKEDKLRWIMDNKLAPLVLSRNVFCEVALMKSIKLGVKEYLIFGSGYDTFGYRNNLVKVFEIDNKEIIDDKINRVNRVLENNNVTYIKANIKNNSFIKSLLENGYYKTRLSLSNLIGLSYFMTKKEFDKLLFNISLLISNGSTIVIDYMSGENLTSVEKVFNKKVKTNYTYEQIEYMLSKNGFLVYEHLESSDVEKLYFERYNMFNPDNEMHAHKNISFICAVKKE